jgi:hypothetical protein
VLVEGRCALRWKALEAFVAAFAPVVGKPTYKARFKFIIAQQIRHQITVAANTENEARTIALAEARQTSRGRRWLAPLEILAHEQTPGACQVTAVERLPPPPSDDDLMWPPLVMP